MPLYHLKDVSVSCNPDFLRQQYKIPDRYDRVEVTERGCEFWCGIEHIFVASHGRCYRYWAVMENGEPVAKHEVWPPKT